MKAIQFNILNSTNPINEVMGKLQKNEYSHVFFIKKEKEVITAICQNPSFAQQISSQISQQTVMIKSGEVLSQFYQEGKGILVCPTEPIVESSTEKY